ncbi:hypothetical protein KM043_001370 [Ampulex compressa]|nr:hypothetical protein KM043_001370 [Ampulex compressa]
MGFAATYLAYLDPCIDSMRTKIILKRLSFDAVRAAHDPPQKLLRTSTHGLNMPNPKGEHIRVLQTRRLAENHGEIPSKQPHVGGTTARASRENGTFIRQEDIDYARSVMAHPPNAHNQI